MILAIDGPAGCGKSSLAKLIAERRGFFYLNSGKMYRAVTWYCLQQGIPYSDETQVLLAAQQGNLEWKTDTLVFWETPMGDQIHTAEVDSQVSQFSRIPSLREFINSIIQKTALQRDLVVEGRDMTTVVFPNADLKIYLDAKPEVRAQRRFQERPEENDFNGILSAIKERDTNDVQNAIRGLKIAQDAIYIDTSYLTIVEVCEKVLSILDEKIRPRSN